MYGTLPDVPDALSVKSGFLSRHRRLVPADAVRSRAVRRRGELVYRLAPLIYLLGAGASVIDPILSLIVFLGLAIYWAFPVRLREA